MRSPNGPMNWPEQELREVARLSETVRETIAHFLAEIRFAMRLAETRPKQKAAWQRLIRRAVALVRDAAVRDRGIGPAIRAAERLLAPLGPAAKQYTVHCVGHAHLDMNWMWNWPETVATVNDTFTTMDRLLTEFPEFRFSQSQAAVYQIMKDYLPELYARVKRQVRAGRWEVTASQWVEGDKNLAAGEILCRHLLYTRRFFQDEFGLAPEAVAIAWEPDTFGHPHTLPGLLVRGGVRRYYFHRGGAGPELFWWEGPDGSRVLAFDDRKRGYIGNIAEYFAKPDFLDHLLGFERATGLKDYLFVYGVGDHGGGPTRRDLLAVRELNRLPIFPNLAFSRTDRFFAIAEKQAGALPVVTGELNFFWEGCYTSQSNVKRANRRSENALVEAETIAWLGQRLAGLPYPADRLRLAWRRAMFNQFHDILPGSGVRATYEHAQGLFQEILATTGAVKTRALRALAGMVDTRSISPGGEKEKGTTDDPSLAGGQGDVGADGMLSRYGAAQGDGQPVVVFNPSPWTRSGLVHTRLWDAAWADRKIAVRGSDGRVGPAQVTERGDYWGHRYVGIVFPAKDVGGLGYRSYRVGRLNASAAVDGRGPGPGRIENEFYALEVEAESGAIVALVDKRTGVDWVPRGGRLAFLEYLLEAPHPMTAWTFGQIVKRTPLLDGAKLEFPCVGPHLATVRVRRRFNDSRFTLSISLAAGVPRIDFALEVDWLERGGPEIGVPMLKAVFPFALDEPQPTFECPNGHIARSARPKDIPCRTNNLLGLYYPRTEAVDFNPAEVPAQKWADLSGIHRRTGQRAGVTLLNDSKYGHRVDGNCLRLTLLRSSYDPDPLPELGAHQIRFALRPHMGAWSAADATRAGYEFNFPFNVVSPTEQTGRLPADNCWAEILTRNVMLSALKPAENSQALIVRLYEMEGRATLARLRLSPSLASPKARAVATDLLERPLAINTARLRNGTLEVKLPAFGTTTVRLG